MRNDHHAISVEVGTAESLRNAGVNTDGVSRLPKGAASLLVTVVDHELGDLESTAMRITNERYNLAVSIVRRVDLVLLHVGERKNNLRTLTGKGLGLEVNRRRVAIIGQRNEQLLPKARVRQLHDVVVLLLLRLPHFGELLLGENGGLLRKELGSERLAPLVPCSLVVDNIDRRQLLLAVLAFEVQLLADGGAERIVGILLHRLQDGVILWAELRGALFLVRVEDDVHAFRQVITVHGHTFEVMGAIHRNSNLGVGAVAER